MRKKLPEELIHSNEVKSAVLSNLHGVVLDKYGSINTDKIGAFGAYALHCIKTVEDDLGMQSLKCLKVSGTEKNLIFQFDKSLFIAVEGDKELKEQILGEFFDS